METKCKVCGGEVTIAPSGEPNQFCKECYKKLKGNGFAHLNGNNAGISSQEAKPQQKVSEDQLHRTKSNLIVTVFEKVYDKRKTQDTNLNEIKWYFDNLLKLI